MPHLLHRLGSCAMLSTLLSLAACQDDPIGPVTSTPGAASAAGAVAANNWTTRAAYPRLILEATSASIINPTTRRTIVYVIGGNIQRSSGPGNITDRVRAYDVHANTWRDRAPYPVRVRATNGAVEINGKIYVSGGFTRRWDEQAGVWRSQTIRSLHVYDPVTNRWTKRRDLPIATVRGVSAAYQGRLYVATSCYDTAVCGEQYDLGALWRYTPANDTWVLLGRTPHNPGYGAGGFIDGKLYLVAELGEVDVYDPATNSWSSGPQRPERRCTPAYATFQAKLYLVGCRDDFDTSGVWPMLVFDPRSGSWSQAAAPPVAATGYGWTLSRVIANGQPRLELFGGDPPNNNLQYAP
jgi:N-acetylneuraminic acid mutarotase